MAKWHRLFIAAELFALNAAALFPQGKSPTEEWRVDIIPWSEHNPAAFAGAHNKGKRLIMCFDEASEIPQIIHETAAGAETDKDTEIIRVLFGNGTDPESFFREVTPEGRYSERWWTKRVDSRDVSITNKKHIQEEIDLHGVDSDYVRVRYLGLFARQAADSFISRDVAEHAAARLPPEANDLPFVLGVDIARKGKDQTIIYPRRGLDAQSYAPIVVPRSDTLQIVEHILMACRQFDPEIVFIDQGYIGMSILDILWNRRLGRPLFIAVDFGSRPDGTNEVIADAKYLNKRAEIWGAMRAWLTRGSIVDRVSGAKNTLVGELVAQTYIMTKHDTLIQLTSKEKMRSSGLDSPNLADALACTFANPGLLESQYNTPTERYPEFRAMQDAQALDYNPFSAEVSL